MGQWGSSPRVWGQGGTFVKKKCGTGIIPTRMGTSCHIGIDSGADTDHPHAYGDKLFYACLTGLRPGSSPRVWGQVVLVISDLPFTRIIPTRMGTSRDIVVKHLPDWDHPHAYGDKDMRRICITKSLGSSPRVWGQETSSNFNENPKRIIPTRMGTRATLYEEDGYTEDHPHAYGDKV